MQLPDINKVESKSYFDTIVDLLEDINAARSWMVEFEERFGRELKAWDLPNCVALHDGQCIAFKSVDRFYLNTDIRYYINAESGSWQSYCSISSNGDVHICYAEHTNYVERGLVTWRLPGDPVPIPSGCIKLAEREISNMDKELADPGMSFLKKAKLLHKRGNLVYKIKEIRKIWKLEQKLAVSADGSFSRYNKTAIAKFFSDDEYQTMKNYLKCLATRIAEASGPDVSLQKLLEQIDSQYSTWNAEKQKI
jgi:hypothetical protein